MTNDEQAMRYGLTALEKNAKESTEAHAIVNEITGYGVTQRQLMLIIKRLGMNLENRDHMRVIAHMIDELLDEEEVEDVIDIEGPLPSFDSKLITPGK
jgi:hypothetical protein